MPAAAPAAAHAADLHYDRRNTNPMLCLGRNLLPIVCMPKFGSIVWRYFIGTIVLLGVVFRTQPWQYLDAVTEAVHKLIHECAMFGRRMN